MRRRQLLSTLVPPLGTAIWPCVALAEAPTVIGRLHPGPGLDAALRRYLHGFDEGMRALGHVPGRSYRIDARFAGGEMARLGAVAAELVRQKVNLIIASGHPAVRAAKDATDVIPIVMAMSGPDPVGAGLIAALPRPGGNITGLTGQTDEVARKQLEMLRDVVPRLAEVLVIFNPAGPTRPDQQMVDAATQLGLRLRPLPVARPGALDSAFDNLEPRAGRALVVLPDAAVIDRVSAPIAALALKHRLPSAQSYRASVEAGGLLALGIDLFDMHRRSASFVDKILKGKKPADLPVEQPTKFEFVVNLKTATALGLKVPQSV
jgi:putative ABC transport system substrate-binding protein